MVLVDLPENIHGLVLRSVTVSPSSRIVTSNAPFGAPSPVPPVAPSCSITLLTTMVVSPSSLMIQSSPMTSATRRPSRFISR